MKGSPPLVLTIANAKGGVGKSSIAYHLACCFSQQFGDEVGVVDYDNQQSLQSLVNNFDTLNKVPFDLINSQKIKRVDEL
jgi:cellulose biosynthesis protein BcsQ